MSTTRGLVNENGDLASYVIQMIERSYTMESAMKKLTSDFQCYQDDEYINHIGILNLFMSKFNKLYMFSSKGAHPFISEDS